MNTPDTKLRITYLGFVAGHGGDALQMLTLARGVQEAGHDVEIIVPDNVENAVFVERCAAVGVPARQTELLSMIGTGNRQRLRSLLRLLRSIDGDLLHVHSGHTGLPRSMMIALALTRRSRALATLQSPYPFFEPTSARARFWATAARLTLRAVVSPSDHGTRFQQRCGVPSHLTVTIRNSIDDVEFGSGELRRAREALDVDEQVPIVLFSSRLDRQKRPLDAVRAFAAAAPESARLVFVGEGTEERAIVDEARRLGVEHRVVMAGYRTNVPDWLAAATIWIFPTESENFSVALLEAMAAGCPIVATVCQGNDEVLVDGSNALTFAVGDVEGATEALRRLFEDERLREHLSRGARATARDHSADQMVASYLGLYSRIASPST